MKIYPYTVYNTAWHLKDMLCISNLAAQERNQGPHEIYFFFVFIQKQTLVNIWTFVIGFLVSKETVVLRRWESETKIWFYQTS